MKQTTISALVLEKATTILVLGILIGSPASAASVDEGNPGGEDSPEVVRVGIIEDDGTKGDPGDVVFRIVDDEGNEMAITRAEFRDEYLYRVGLAPNMFRPTVMTMVISDIVKLGAVKLHYREAKSALEEKVAAVKTALEQLNAIPEDDIIARSNAFAELANQISEDPQVKGRGRGGTLGQFGHMQMQYPFDRMAFTAEPGQVIGPFATLFGYHLVFVDRKIKAHTPIAEKCEARHILFFWENAKAKPFKKAAELLRGISVKIEDPAFKTLVPLGMQIGEPEKMVEGEHVEVKAYVGSKRHKEQMKKRLEEEKEEAQEALEALEAEKNKKAEKGEGGGV